MHADWKTNPAQRYHLLNEHAGITLTGATPPKSVGDSRVSAARFAAETMERELRPEALNDSRWELKMYLELFDGLRNLHMRLRDFDDAPLTEAAQAYAQAFIADAFTKEKTQLKAFNMREFKVRHAHPGIDDAVTGYDLVSDSGIPATIALPRSFSERLADDSPAPEQGGGGGRRRGHAA